MIKITTFLGQMLVLEHYALFTSKLDICCSMSQHRQLRYLLLCL